MQDDRNIAASLKRSRRKDINASTLSYEQLFAQISAQIQLEKQALLTHLKNKQKEPALAALRNIVAYASKQTDYKLRILEQAKGSALSESEIENELDVLFAKVAKLSSNVAFLLQS